MPSPITHLVVAVALSSTSIQGQTWEDIGSALPGVSGAPVLSGTGELELGASGALSLASAAPSALAVLFFGLSPVELPFKGGTLVALPAIDIPPFTTSQAGALDLPYVFPIALPAGTELTFQFAIADATAVSGVSLSNGLLGTASLSVPELESFLPTSGGVDTPLTLTGDGYVEDYFDYCVQIRSNGSIVGLCKATETTGDSLSADITAVMPGAVSGEIMVMAGEGRLLPDLSLPADVQLTEDAWIWQSFEGESAVSAGQFTLTNSAAFASQPTVEYFDSTLDANGDIIITFPNDPAPCPPFTEFGLTMDLRTMLGEIGYLEYSAALENPEPLSTINCANRVCLAFQTAAFELDPPVFLPCNAFETSEGVNIIVQPPFGQAWDPNYTAGGLTVRYGQLSPTSGSILSVGAADHWEFRVNAGADVTIELCRTDNTGSGTSTLDPYVCLLDPNGVVVAFDDDNGGDCHVPGPYAAALISSHQATTSGVYTVIAGSFQGQGDETGDYELSVSADVTPCPLTLIVDEGPTCFSLGFGSSK